MDQVAPADGLADVARRLSATFAHLPLETVDAAVHDCAGAFGDAKVRSFVPILVERAAANRLSRIPAQRPVG